MKPSNIGIPSAGASEKPSEEDVKSRLNQVYQGASVSMWLPELQEIQEELGKEEFKAFCQNLCVWGIKTKKGDNFFQALAEMHPGLSLEMDIDQSNLKQVTYAYIQARNDLRLLRLEESEQFETIRNIQRRRETDFDIRLDVYLDEEHDKLQLLQEKQKQLEDLMDAWEGIMLDNGMDAENEFPEDWAEKFD